MKKFLNFSGICALLLAVVAFVLQLATPAVVNSATVLGSKISAETAGTVAIFGKTESTALGDVVTKGSVMALISWILAVVGLVIVLCGVILPLLKVNALEKFAGVLNLCAVVCFVLAGVFMFFVVPTFYAANGVDDVPSTAGIGAGWVIGAIVYIVAGAIAILPAIMDFLGKKK